MLKITRIDKANDQRFCISIEEAETRLENSGCYDEGTIQRLLAAGGDFTLLDYFASYAFEPNASYSGSIRQRDWPTNGNNFIC